MLSTIDANAPIVPTLEICENMEEEEEAKRTRRSKLFC